MNENTDEIYEKVMNSGILEQGIKIGMEKGREIGREEGIEKGIKEGIEKGIKEGIEKGIKEGIEKGIEKGIKEGIEKGIKEGRFNLAIELKNTLGIDKAIELSGFTRKELENETLTPK